MINEENVDNLDKYLKVSKFKIEAEKAKRNSNRLLFSQIDIMSPKRAIIKKTTIIEEPSILSKESDNNDDIKEMKESNYISSNVAVSRSSSLMEQKKHIKKKGNEESIKNIKDFKPGQFGSSRFDKIFKTKISNSNFDGGSELRSDYTHNSNYEFFINDNEKNKEFGLRDNTISTTKYNLLTFIPKGLLYQFARLSNVYFLFIAIIQSIPLISPLNSLTAIIPLIFVLGVSMIRELVEDFGRNKYDSLNNNEEVIVLRDGKFKKSKSRTLRSGEIVLIYENRPIPADLLLIDSGMREGECYIETSSLDGEKTLKLKIANKKIYGLISKRIENNKNKKIEKIKDLINFTISGFIQVTAANANLNQIDGKLNFFIQEDNTIKEDNFIITIKEFLLKGSILKNTNWIIGIIIYTGMNNKIILNSKKPRMKMSQIELRMNNCLIVIFSFLLICCIGCSILHFYDYKQNEKFYNHFVPLDKELAQDSFINFFTYFLLLNTLIPISLIVTIEIVKMIQGIFIEWDTKLYCKSKHYFCRAKTVSLNEELGNVNFIFSDKTGTLTMNQLNFKYCIIKNSCYECIDLIKASKKNSIKFQKKNSTSNVGESKKNLPDICKRVNEGFFHDLIRKKYEKIQECEENGNTIIDNNHIIYKAELEDDIFFINEFFTALSITNECMVNDNKGEIRYIGTSPDDLELVKMASRQGYKLIQTSFDKKTVLIDGKKVIFEILNILNFSSERKRMSIIFKEATGKIKMYTKGADCEIIKRLSEKSKNSEIFNKINNDVECFSNLGFRTLMVAYREIEENEFYNWREKLHVEELNLQKKHKIIDKYYDAIEKNFELLGATIVEDKLQDKVPETIKEIKSAGIKFWVLTGDKMSTAENIGFSCNLISKQQQIFKLSCLDNDVERIKYDSYQEIMKFFSEFQQYLKFLANKYNYERINSIISKTSEIRHDRASYKDDVSSNLSTSYAINFELFKLLKDKKYIEPYSILIEAPILIGLFRDEEQTEKFLSICYNAESVVCCRVSPFQKSQIVQKMKIYDRNAVTLAIGDGGNDVSMIMEANIGIGIIGEEGMSAANASDFAIGEFKLIKRLLFFQGRTNLNRISKLILYFFYKNIIFTIAQLFFSPFSLCSGQTIIDDWYITCYNLVFTAFPLCVTSLTDFDVLDKDGKQVEESLPLLYKESRDEKKVFSVFNFFQVIAKGILISLIMFIICMQNQVLNLKGNISDLWYTSLLYYLSILFVVTNHLFFITQYIVFFLPIVVLITTFLLLIIFLLLVHYGLLFEFKSKATIFPALENFSFYLYLLFLIGFNIIIDYCLKLKRFYLDNSLSSKLDRKRFKDKLKMLRNKLFPLKKLKLNKNKIRNCNSIEYSGLSLMNKSNLKHISLDSDKISYLNKKNLSRLSGYKISSLKKIPELSNDKNEK